jgi:hypothetical protein
LRNLPGTLLFEERTETACSSQPAKMAAAKKAVTAAAFRPQDFEIRKEQSGQAAHQSD